MKKGKKNLFKNLVPIISIILSTGIIVLLVIPLIQDIFKNIEKIETNYSTITAFDQKLREIEADIVNSSIYTSQVTKLNSLSISNNVQIIEFRDRIANIARQLDLNISSEKISETSKKGDRGFVLTEVPFEFEISGNFDKIRLLIEEFDNLQDIIVIREMSLTQNSSLDQSNQPVDNQWILNITLSRYILPQTIPSDFDQDFSQLKISEEVINFLN